MPDPVDDIELVKRSVGGEHAAFEVLVSRYQVLVCSIAFSAVGNVMSSEDIAQEAFIVAWKKLAELRDPSQFKSWLGTIARNEARMWLRRRANSLQELEHPAKIPAAQTEEAVVDDEEADLVWDTLSQLPESYREPLVLFHRCDQSVAEVAGALSLSESATKQRLARGREMLRSEVMATIEQRLRKTCPTSAFTVGVMAVIGASSKTAAAATGVATTTAVSTATKAAAGGAVAGSLLGLLGGFGGAFASWYNAEYESQRHMIVRQGVAYLIGISIFGAPFLAMQFGWRPTETLGVRGYSIAHAVWMLSFFSLNLIWMACAIRGYNRLERNERAANTERLPRYQAALKAGWKREGFRWTSQATFMQLPLFQIAVPDQYVGIEPETVASQGTARAWVAVGHFAYGNAVGVGHRAVAPVAVGVQAIGGIACGVMSIGGVSLGVVSIAPLALGVLCVGGLSLAGSVAVGIWAIAPLAIAAIAAKGAMAMSLKFAIAPSAFGPEANTVAANEYFASTTWLSQFDRWLHSLANAPAGDSNYRHWIAGTVLICVLAWILATKLRQVFGARG